MKFRHMKKKGYIFLIDGIFAILILTIGFLIISSGKAENSPDVPVATVSENVMEVISTVKLSEICYDQLTCSCKSVILRDRCEQGMILNFDESLLDYIVELYSKNKIDEARIIFRNITDEKAIFRTDIFGVELRIDGKRIYPELSVQNNKEKSKTLISNKRIVIGTYEDISKGEFNSFGPYLAEIDIWKK